ncbi:MAG: phosphotransferase [Pseudomonadota bacterium]
MDFDFLKLFIPESPGAEIIWVGEESSKAFSTKGQVVDCAVATSLGFDLLGFCRVVKETGIFVVFWENPLSYLAIKKNPFTIFRKKNSLSHELKRHGFHCQIKFSCDGECQRIFLLDHLPTQKLQVSGNLKDIKNSLFSSRFFQPFMPYQGIVASRNGDFDIPLVSITQLVEQKGFDGSFEGCFISKTGIAVIEFPELIVRMGLNTTGNKRVVNNAENINKVLMGGHSVLRQKIPITIASGKLGLCSFCAESKIRGENAEVVAKNPTLVQTMTSDAAQFLLDFSKKSVELVSMDNGIMSLYVEAPFNRIIEFSKCSVNVAFLLQVKNYVVKLLRGQMIPLVCQHGDYKLANMKFDAVSGKLTGVFDWDMAELRGLPVLDLYHLLLSDEIVGPSAVNRVDVLAEKLFPFQFKAWHRDLLWGYFESMHIAKALERAFALLYWVGQLVKRIRHGEISNDVERSIDQKILKLTPVIINEFGNKIH